MYHCETKCVKVEIDFGNCILGPTQPQPLYVLRAVILEPAYQPVQGWPSLSIITTEEITIECIFLI
jgi:hypothetical protein